MLNKFRPQQTPSGELQPYRDLRDVDMSNWGTPEVDETSASLSQDGLLGNDGFRPMRGQVPKWAPGEFEEWKMGKLTGMGTAWGRNRQMEHQMSVIPGMVDLHRQGAANAKRVMAGHVGMNNPALIALMKGLK